MIYCNIIFFSLLLSRAIIQCSLLSTAQAAEENLLKFCNSSLVEKSDDAVVSCNECYLYFAPSSIHGAGMGVYVTKSFRQGEVISSSDYGSIIPIIDPYKHPNHRKWTSLVNYYAWTQPTAASDELEYEAERVNDIQLGVGCFPNSHSYLHNLGFVLPNITYDDNLEQHEGSGAFSYHRGREFIALRDIEAGEELFLDYGDRFLDSRKTLSNVPRKSDFEAAAKLVKSIKRDLDRTLELLLTSIERKHNTLLIADLKKGIVGMYSRIIFMFV